MDLVPTRAAGLARLAEFLPRAGRFYAAERNTDRGPKAAPTTSVLSPYLRRRLITESEAIRAASGTHREGAGKFVEEVLWRGYWKGFLEQYPAVWTRYQVELAAARARLAAEPGLRRMFQDATEGRTGIACFDAWASELVARNWLHNHARMWFASIWMFTLGLPWPLGAAFFARHLLDGDPASNTLSWRWVAGLHTRGKAYVARAENIARYTEGRFDPAGQLDEDPRPLTEPGSPPATPLPPADPLPSGDVALLLHGDDLSPETLPLSGMRVRAIVGFRAPEEVAPAVAAFDEGALRDGLARAGHCFGCGAEAIPAAAVRDWCARAGLPVVTPYAPIGANADILAGLPVSRIRRSYDAAAWPHARRGFFHLRAKIPDILAAGASAAAGAICAS